LIVKAMNIISFGGFVSFINLKNVCQFVFVLCSDMHSPFHFMLMIAENTLKGSGESFMTFINHFYDVFNQSTYYIQSLLLVCNYYSLRNSLPSITFFTAVKRFNVYQTIVLLEVSG